MTAASTATPVQHAVLVEAMEQRALLSDATGTAERFDEVNSRLRSAIEQTVQYFFSSRLGDQLFGRVREGVVATDDGTLPAGDGGCDDATDTGSDSATQDGQDPGTPGSADEAGEGGWVGDFREFPKDKHDTRDDEAGENTDEDESDGRGSNDSGDSNGGNSSDGSGEGVSHTLGFEDLTGEEISWSGGLGGGTISIGNLLPGGGSFPVANPPPFQAAAPTVIIGTPANFSSNAGANAPAPAPAPNAQPSASTPSTAPRTTSATTALRAATANFVSTAGATSAASTPTTTADASTAPAAAAPSNTRSTADDIADVEQPELASVLVNATGTGAAAPAPTQVEGFFGTQAVMLYMYLAGPATVSTVAVLDGADTATMLGAGLPAVATESAVIAANAVAQAATNIAGPTVEAARRVYEIVHLGSPFLLIADSVGTFVEESAFIPERLVAVATAGPRRASIITVAVIAADIALLTYAYHRGRRARQRKQDTIRVSLRRSERPHFDSDAFADAALIRA